MKKRGDSFFKKLKKNCNGIVTDYLPWLLLGLIVLVILFIYLFVLKGEGESMIDRIKNIFSFR